MDQQQDDFFTGGQAEGDFEQFEHVPGDVPAADGPTDASYNNFGGGDFQGQDFSGGGQDFSGGGQDFSGGDFGGGDFQNGGQFASYDQQPVYNGGDSMGYGSLDGQDNGMGMSMSIPEPEPAATALDTFLAKWEAGLKDKATAEQAKKQEAIAKAKEDRAKFNSERASQREAKMSQNRNQEQVFLEQLEADLESDNPWERMVNLVDLQAEVTGEFQDTSRMRSIFIQLKNAPPQKAGAK